MGWYAEGPIEDGRELGPALWRAIRQVKDGQPALIDSVTRFDERSDQLSAISHQESHRARIVVGQVGVVTLHIELANQG